MALVVEDGTAKNEANSFVSEADFIQFCEARGVTIENETVARKHLVLAMDYITFQMVNISGEPVSQTQGTPFPRNDCIIGTVKFPNNAVPRMAELAQMFAAIASFNGIDLNPVQQNGKVLISKTTGPIKKEWFYNKDMDTVPTIPQVSAFIEQMMGSGFKVLENLRA